MSNFAPLTGRREHEVRSKNTRTLKGNGTTELPVPGLRSVTAVRVGDCVLPMDHSIRVPHPFDSESKLDLPVPMVSLDTSPDGETVLRRSTLSNSGVWQDSVPIYVEGDWEPEAPAAPPAPDPEIARLKAELAAAQAQLASNAGKK